MRRIHDYRRGVRVCVVPKTAGFSTEVRNPAPQGEKLPIDQDDHETGEFAVQAHHRGVCGDGHLYQAGIIRTPRTNFASPKVLLGPICSLRQTEARNTWWEGNAPRLQPSAAQQEVVSKACIASFTPVLRMWSIGIANVWLSLKPLPLWRRWLLTPE